MKLIDFIDKYTQWLDFSWMVTRPPIDNIEKEQKYIKIQNNIVTYNDKISLLDNTQKYDYNTIQKIKS